MPSDSYVFHINTNHRGLISTRFSLKYMQFRIFHKLKAIRSQIQKLKKNKTQLSDERKFRHDVTLSQCYLNRVREHHILPSYWQNVNISHLFYKYKELWYFEYMYSQRTIRDFLTYWMLNDHSWGFLDIECTCMMVFNLHFKSIQNTTIKN